jgi:uncharacterized protein
MSKAKFLLDVNALVALTTEDHVHHGIVTRWFNATGRHNWGACAFTEAGLLRVATRPSTGGRSVHEVTELLTRLAAHPGYRYWPLTASWTALAGPFQGRLFGHQQITDAFLLGLAVQQRGILVTLDQAMTHLAGPEYRRHLLVLS